ncbi:MAG: ArsC/Spx/MgsR family protein [Pseudomonadota bacterium]
MTAADPIILHNPRCSKSRQTLALLREAGHEPVIREYLKEPLSRDELQRLGAQLIHPISDLVRGNDARPLGFVAGQHDVLEWLVEHPQTMQRPVVIARGRAAIGRPPESTLTLFDEPNTTDETS